MKWNERTEFFAADCTMPPRAAPRVSVEEQEKIYLTKRLYAFHESDDSCLSHQPRWRCDDACADLELPPTLGVTARAFCHDICKKLGLFSKSKGVGERRFLTISKPGADVATRQFNCAPAAATPAVVHPLPQPRSFG